MISPVVAAPVIDEPAVLDEASGKWRAAAVVEVAEGEPVFAGHYPDFPIFPGVCIVDCAHSVASVATPDGARLTLAAVESTRFIGAVYPGDVLSISLEWSWRGDHWRCAAVAATGRGKAATLRLRYRTEEDR